MQHLVYSLCLVIHITGITLMAGATFMDYTIFRQFSKLWPVDKPRAITLENILTRFQRFMGIGMLFILLSGVGMMAYMHRIWGQQLWFQVKMGILLLVIVNGLGIRRRLGTSLHKNMLNPAADKDLFLTQKNMTRVQLVQLFLFLVIFILSVFKFN